MSAAWRSVTCALVVFAVLAGAGHSAADATQDRQLKELQQRIGKVRSELQRDVKKRDATSDKLRQIESQIGTTQNKISSLRAERVASKARLADLRVQEKNSSDALDDDKSALAMEVRAAFMNGRQEQLKLLLDQRDPAQLGRMSVYFQMFSAQRARQIEQVIERLAALREVTDKVAAETARLAELQKAQERELGTLQSARSERLTLLDELAARITAGDRQVNQLEAEEQRLQELIADLQKLLEEYPVASRDAFPRLKGKLAWPLNGQLVADYGQPRAGQKMKWNGVLVAASRGASVRAIARGRVAYADWLPGLGLLTVLEHSDGYISLYGHNETLARQAGEWVNAGDELSTVGDSGGQRQSALYFEIRRGRTPLNPHPWFKSKVSGK